VGSGGPYVYFGPWMPRGADAGSFVAEVFYASGSFSLDVLLSDNRRHILFDHRNGDFR